MSDNRVWSIDEDQEGILWFGTEKGLTRYDPVGKTFTQYLSDAANPHSLSFNKILAIEVDHAGSVWVGTAGGGLNKLDPGSGNFTVFKNNEDDPTSLSSNAVRYILEDRRKRLWIATSGGGLNRFDSAAENFVRYGHDPKNPHSLSNNSLKGLAEGLWVATWGGGLNKFDPETETFIRYQHDKKNPNSLSVNDVTAICQDNTGTLWLGMYGGGVNKLDPLGAKFKHYRFIEGNPRSLSHNNVFNIHTQYVPEKGQDIVWIGTSGGLDKFDRTSNTFTHYQHDPGNPNSLSNNTVTFITGDPDGSKDILWIGTFRGINRFDPATETFVRYQHDPNNVHSLDGSYVWHIHGDKQGKLWIGTWGGGLNKFDPETGTFVHYKHDETNPQSISDNTVSSIYEDSQGVLWITTFGGGLNMFDREKETFVRFQHTADDPGSLSLNDVRSVYESRAGTLWVGTFGGGLNKYDRETGSFTHYRRKEGLPHGVVNGILEDIQGFLWLSTNGGLAKFDPQTETFRNYDVRDGLQSNLFNLGAYHQSRSGELFFGGIAGLNVFDPLTLKDNPHQPPVYITDFRIFDRPVGIGRGNSPLRQSILDTRALVLSHKDNFFSFEFAALNYTLSEKNQYRYIMEGVDKDWISRDAQRRYASYTNLDPGRYTFRVKASNNDGLWNEAGTSLAITITPPWWQTVWFRALAVMLGIGLLLALFRWRVTAMEARNRELEKQVAARTQDLQVAKEQAETANQAKSFFLANMSHELRTPLNAVLGFAEILFHREQEPGKKNYLKSIQTSGQSLLSLINDILDISKIEAGKMELNNTPVSMLGLCNEMRSIFQHKISTKGLRFEVKADETLPGALLLDANRLRQVLINLLNNAAKFTEEGFVSLVCRQANKAGGASGTVNLIIEVTDSGPGIAPEYQERIFDAFEQVPTRRGSPVEGSGLGLAITHRIVQLMQGSISLTSSPGAGASFTVELPQVEIAADKFLAADRNLDYDPARIHFAPAKILIVDDIQYNRDVLAAYLELPNISRAFAADGQQAVEKATAELPDLILMDIKMPGMDGYEATQLIKKNPATGHIPVVAVTASVLKQDEESIRQQCDGYLSKPINQQMLIKQLKKYLKYTEEEYSAVPGGAGAQRVVPPAAELKILYEIALDGDMDDIAAHLKELHEGEEKLKPFCDEFSTLALGYEYQIIIRRLENLLKAAGASNE